MDKKWTGAWTTGIDESLDEGRGGLGIEIDNLKVAVGRMIRLELPGGAWGVSVGAAAVGFCASVTVAEFE